MPRLTPPQALDQLAEWINASTDEVGIDGLLQQHGNRIPRRTLQRHLAVLGGTAVATAVDVCADAPGCGRRW